MNLSIGEAVTNRWTEPALVNLSVSVAVTNLPTFLAVTNLSTGAAVTWTVFKFRTELESVPTAVDVMDTVPVMGTMPIKAAVDVQRIAAVPLAIA